MYYDVVLIEKYATAGLTAQEMSECFASLSCQQAYPVEYQATEVESSAMGLISANAAAAINYDTGESSALHWFISDILNDVEKETPDGVYYFNGLSVKLSR